MLKFPNIDPEIFSIGQVSVRWYGLMYAIGFLAAYFIILHLAPKRKLSLNGKMIGDYLVYAILGVMLGGRLGYVLFYKFSHYLDHPLEILAVWKGGMSFHGGLLGVVVASLVFCRKHKLNVLALGDVLVTASTIGLGLGRIGNFINGELWGRPTSLPWGMVFPHGGPLPRHPSQLYQAFLEGIVLFSVLWWLNCRGSARGVPFFTFFLLYGSFRFLVEFAREPDAHLGLVLGFMSMGQVLSLPMILFGFAGLFWLWLKQKQEH